MKHASFVIFASAFLVVACGEEETGAGETFGGQDGGEYQQAVQDQGRQSGAPLAPSQMSSDGQAARPAADRQIPGVPAGMQVAQVLDRNGFEKPMVAATKLIPAGWKVNGGVVWNINAGPSGCGKNTPYVDWTATSPDGLGMISMLPEETWTALNHNVAMMGQMPQRCPPKPTETKAFILDYAQRYRPGSRVLDYRDVTDTLKELHSQLQPHQTDPYGNETRQWAGGGQALIGYQVNGREVRELIGTVVIFNQMRMPGLMQGEYSEIISTMVMPGFAMRMPEGQLDFDKAEFFRESGKVNPAWQSRMQKYHAKNAKIQADSNAKISAINAKGAADRSKIISQTNNEISDIQMQTWRNTQESNDRGQREFREAIGGYETYNDPSTGGTVELDNTYDRAFQLNDGTNVLTNDAFFEPFADTGQDGQQLEPTP